MVYQNVLGIQGYGLEGYPKHSLANTGCKHFSAFDGPMNWSENGLGLCPLFMLCIDDASFYQDKLGTNVGVALLTREECYCRLIDAGARRCCLTQTGS